MNHRHHHNHHSPRFKEGDVVWAKSSSTKWSPAVILNSKLHPKDPFPIFSLSFFDDKFPRYRVENELRSFEKHFPHYVKHLACTTTNTATTFKPLLDRVLKYLGEREELNLKCRCLVNSAQEKGNLGKQEEKKKGLVFCFRMEEVLGYMRGVSVEGFVEEVELVGAAKMAARVRVIRKYFEVRERDFLREVRRRRRIRESQMAGCLNDFNYLKVGMQLKPCCSSFLAEKRKWVVFDYGQQETEWQVLSEKTAACSMNDAVDVANDLAAFNGKMFQESIPVDRISKKAKVSIEQNKTISFPLMLENLQCLALDLFHLSRECLDSFVGNFLRIRTWTCQNSRKYWKNRHRSYENVEAPFSSDEKFGTRLKDHTDQQSPQGIFNALAPSMKSNPCLESKAQLLPALGSSVVHNATIFSIIRDVIIFQRSQLTTDAEVSGDQISACSVYLRDLSFGLNSNTSLSCEKDLACKLKRSSSEANGSCCLLGIMTQLICQNTALFMSRSLRYELRNCFFKMFQSRFLHKYCRSYAFGITQVLDATNVADIDSDKEVWVTSTKTEECQEDISIAPDRWSCVSYNQQCAEETASGLAATGLIGHRDIMILPPSSVTPPLAHRVHDVVHVYQLYQGFKISHYSEVQNMKTMPAGTLDGTTSEIVHELCQTSSTECDENKKLCHDIHPDALAVSQATHQLEARKSWLFPTSLHMKFPKGCSLPTRKELIKKFIRFGPINSPLTKVHPTPSSARVVFLHKVDAVAAYHYAKRKKVFLGLGNVKFWLDSNKNVRSGSNTSLITGQKSCLKRSGHLGRESKGPPKVVRFLMDT